MPNPNWTVPGQPWLEQVNAVRRTLIGKHTDNAVLPIVDLLKMLPLNPSDNETLNDLIARGSLTFAAAKVSNVAQDVTRASFMDDNVGSVRISVPKDVKASVAVLNDEIDFVSEGEDILIILADLPTQWPFSGNFVLRKLQMRPDRVLYTLQDQIQPHGWFEITVDLQAALTPLIALAALRAMPAHRRRKVALALKALRDEEDSCFGADDGTASWYITQGGVMGTCRIQHGNEHVLGTIIYGPDTLSGCRVKLKQLQDAGTCP